MSLRTSPWRLATVAMAAVAFATPHATPAAVIECGETLVRQLGSAPEELGFLAFPGEVVSATVVAATESSAFVPRWRVADVEGRPEALSNGEDLCTGRCETAPLPGGLAFTLRIADLGQGQGAYVVSLEAVSATAHGLSNGPPIPTCLRTRLGQPDGTRPIGADPLTGTIDGAGETDTFTLVVQAGDQLRVTLARTGGDAELAPVWQAFDAAGAPVPSLADGETAPFAIGGVATILVSDASLRASGSYVIQVGCEHPSTTSTTGIATTSTTTDDSSTTTSTTGTSATSTSTTTANGNPTTTSSTATPASTTTVTVAGPTTSTLAPTFDLDMVFRGPALGSQGRLAGVLATSNGRLLIGAPHENIGQGANLVRNAGAVLVVDVAGAVGSPTFGRVTRVVRPDSPASGDELGAALAAADDGVITGAPGARAAFVFSDVQMRDAVTIASPSGVADDDFGRAVAAPDGLVVVGAPGVEGGAGSAYVFERSGGAPRAFLNAPAPIAGARMGAALASSGTLVLVGAPGGAGVPGRVFLFDAATGALLQTLVADSPAGGDEFGAAVTFADGDLLVGAPGTDGGRGRVCRFDAVTGKATRCYAAPSPAAADRFGASLAVADGLLLVGAPGSATVALGGGAVHVFDLASGLPVETLEKPMPQADDAFGTAVALGGGRLFVGTPGDDVGTVDGGTAHVFEGGALVAVLRERLSVDELGSAVTAAMDGGFYVGAPGSEYVLRVGPGAAGTGALSRTPGPGSGRFGAAVAALDGMLVVGAPEASGAAGDRVGAVHLFDGPTLRGTLQNPTPGAGDEFGFAVGTIDGDVLASAPSAGVSDTGLAYRLDLTGRLKVTYGKPAPSAGDFFGAALAGDQGQVLVGAPFDASGGAPAGAVYLFDGDSAAIVHAVPNPNASSDLFGASVALGQWIVVGAPLAADDLGAVGTVWVFDRATAALVRRLENPRGGSFDAFGASVALRGEQLIVGAPGGDDSVDDSGFVYLFDVPTGQLLQTFRNPPQTSFDRFGFAVAASDSGILVGSPGPSRIYLFEPIASSAGLARAAAPLLAVAPSTCGNGLVEPGEACDDGNDIDTDDCRNDCTAGLCCALDALADVEARCADGDPCTTDLLDPAGGCRYESSGAPGCCTDDSQCPSGQCRICVGCFIYHWDCCDQGSSCVPSNPACAGKTCVEAAACQCEGKLDCGGETLPDELRAPFVDACDTLRLQLSVSPEGTLTRSELVQARHQTRNARGSLRKTLRTARALTRSHQLSRICRKQITAQVRVVRRAIPKGKKLRRCLQNPS